MENSLVPVDRISNLPDELLCHILSFLPTKLAFSTTLLSKRWNSLFKLLTTLHFDDESVRDKECFLRFIDTVMLSNHLIKTFHLKCGSIYWFPWRKTLRSNIERWMETAKRHPVANLKFLGTYQKIPLPPSTFSLSTVVVLELTNVYVAGNIYVHLPLLKTLHLIGAVFEYREFFKAILSGCPILEDLHTRIFYARKHEDIRPNTKDFTTLSKLIRANIGTFDAPLKAIQNVEFLKVQMNKRLPNPKIGSYYACFPVFRNLLHLELCFYDFQHWGEVVEVLHYCPKLRILSIDKLGRNLRVYESSFINWKHPNSFPECILSNLRSCTINYDEILDEVQFATYILQNARLLEVMKIIISNVFRPLMNEDVLEELRSCPMISPKCKLSIGFT